MLTAHLFTLEGHLFLDCIFDIKPDADAILAHHLLTVDLSGGSGPSPTLSVSLLNHEFIKTYLKTNSTALRHLPESNVKSEDGPVVLTADTTELQKFILRHYGDTNFFAKTEPMQKMETK